MILTHKKCIKLIKTPRGIIKNWSFVTTPHVKTRGITDAIALMFSADIVTHPVTKRVYNKQDPKNDLRLFLFRNYKGVFEQPGGSANDVFLKIYIDSVLNDKLFNKFKTLVPFTEDVFKKTWISENISATIGINVDTNMKKIFNNDVSDITQLPIVTKSLCSLLNNIGILPVKGGVMVGEYERLAPHHCKKCSAEYPPREWRFVTEIDLVGYDTTDKTCTLIELKTYKNAIIPQYILAKYNLQAWISWCLFSMTYPGLMQYTKAIIAVVTPVTHTIQLFNVRPPRVKSRLIKVFPFLGQMCSTMYQLLTPHMASPMIKGAYKAAQINCDGTLNLFSQSTALKPRAPRKPMTEEQKKDERKRKAIYYQVKKRSKMSQEDVYDKPHKRARRNPVNEA